MKPARFTYYDPSTQEEALALLAQHGDDIKVLAGGQSLVPLLSMRLAQPLYLLDINRLSGLSYIRAEEGGMRVGALTRQRTLERSVLVREHYPLLAEALPFIGHTPIRARGTLGGSLAHADPAAELPAILLALDGRVRVISQHGSREIAATDFFVDQLQTALQSDELLTEVWFPTVPAGTGSAFLEVSRRHGDYALAGVAAQVTLQPDGTVTRTRIVLLGVSETVVRAQEAENLLICEQITEKIAQEAAEKACATINMRSDVHVGPQYRRTVATTLVSKALMKAANRATSTSSGAIT